MESEHVVRDSSPRYFHIQSNLNIGWIYHLQGVNQEEAEDWPIASNTCSCLSHFITTFIFGNIQGIRILRSSIKNVV